MEEGVEMEEERKGERGVEVMSGRKRKEKERKTVRKKECRRNEEDLVKK